MKIERFINGKKVSKKEIAKIKISVEKITR